MSLYRVMLDLWNPGSPEPMVKDVILFVQALDRADLKRQLDIGVVVPGVVAVQYEYGNLRMSRVATLPRYARFAVDASSPYLHASRGVGDAVTFVTDGDYHVTWLPAPRPDAHSGGFATWRFGGISSYMYSVEPCGLVTFHHTGPQRFRPGPSDELISQVQRWHNLRRLKENNA